MARYAGLAFALLHLAAFLVFVVYIAHSDDPQAALLWGIFAVIDFPLSLLYLLAGSIYSHGTQHMKQEFTQYVYFPYLIHGLFGTVWWYFLPRLLTPRRFGGVW
jgi:hypothetical protein